MTKPRFTPDPLPDGLDPTLASYLQRQFDRINDWWPKDLESRVQALEQNYPYVSGEWPIIDYSAVSFEGAASEVTLYTAQAFIAMSYATGSGFSVSLSAYDDFQSPYVANESLFAPYDIRSDGSGTFATVANDEIWYSTDGLNWTQSTGVWSVTGAPIGGLVWDATNNRWLAAMQHPNKAPSNYGFYVRASTDLINWSTVYESDTNTAGCVGLAIDENGVLLAAGNYNSAPYIRYSTDYGVSWTLVDVSSLSPASFYLTNCEYSNGRWFLTGSYALIFSSTQPHTGYVQAYAGTQFDLIYWVSYGKTGTGGDLWLAIGYSNTASRRFLYSTNGTSFGTVTPPSGRSLQNTTGRNVVYDDNYKWLFAGGGELWKSSDGTTWVEAPDNGSFSGMVAAAVLYVAT